MSGYSAAPVPASDAVMLRVEEAAPLMRLSRTEVYRLIASGELGSVRIGRRRRVPRSAIDTYVERQLAAGQCVG